MIRYTINNIDISSLLIEEPSVSHRLNRYQDFSVSTVVFTLYNDLFLFSIENTDSLLNAKKEILNNIPVKFYDDETNEIFWYGVIDNISPKSFKIVEITSSEIFVKIFDAKYCQYYNGDGWSGDGSYAGDDVNNVKHALALLHRYISDEFINLNSFNAISDQLDNLSIQISCTYFYPDNKTPFSFLKDLEMGIVKFIIMNNQICVEMRYTNLGKRGILIPSSIFIGYDKISREKNDKYYSFVEIKYNGGVEKQYLGESNTNVNYYSALQYIEDLTADWTANEFKGQYISLNNASDISFLDKIVLIESNSKTKIFFTNVNNEWTGDCTCDYAIMETNNGYTIDYSNDQSIEMTDGASAIAATILAIQSSEKLNIEIEIIDEQNIFMVGQIICLNDPDQGFNYQSFRIEKIDKRINEKLIRIFAVDEMLYPAISNLYTVLATPVLTGIRTMADEAELSWGAIAGAYLYKLYYGISPNNLNQIVLTVATSYRLTALQRSLSYYAELVAISVDGIESPRSNRVTLERWEVGLNDFIDGMPWYDLTYFDQWGFLENYYFVLTYKLINYLDIKFLQKNNLIILDSSQITSSQEISQGEVLSQFQKQTSSKSIPNILGYIDTAGVTDNTTASSIVTEIGEAKYLKVPDTFGKSLYINGSVYASGASITNSNLWFLKYGSSYYQYWSVNNYMMDISDADYIEWFKVWKIDKVLGFFEGNEYLAASAGTVETGKFTASSQTKIADWTTNQWENYYVCFPELSGRQWYRITANTAHELTIEYIGETTNITQYFINDINTYGFDGVFMDDVWTELYNTINGQIVDQNGTSNSTCDWVGDDWLTDTSKNLITNQYIGYYIQINNDGIWRQLTGNSSTVYYFSSSGYSQAGLPYEVISPLEYATGKKYGELLAEFLGIIIPYIELVSKRKTGSTVKITQGNIILNTYPNNWTDYQSFVDILTQGSSQHFVMDEALQSSWNSGVPSANKKFLVLDWGHALDRHNKLKILNTAGLKYPRVVTLGYPFCAKAYLWHICGNLLLSHYNSTTKIIEDMVSGGDANLKELFFDVNQVQNSPYLQNDFNGGYTIGLPVSSMVYNSNDRYYTCYREFTGCWIFYNPSRKLQVFTFDFGAETVVDNISGEEFTGLTEIFLLPRSANIYYRLDSSAGVVAASYYNSNRIFSYVDANAGWIILTTSGATKVLNNSIWIKSTTGHSPHKTIIDNNNYTLPIGDSDLLFHGGHASYPVVSGYDAETENITGVSDASVALTNHTIYGVVRVENTTDAVDLIFGQDVFIEFEDGYIGGEGQWVTKIYFNGAYAGKSITIYFYSQGLGGDGTPDIDFQNKELGVIYRRTNLELWTGAIDYADCIDIGTQLIEGADFYFIYEPVRWHWQYRQRINSLAVDGNLYIKTKKLKKPPNTTNVQALQWGYIDVNNLTLIDASKTYEDSVNGAIANYATRTIKRPKVLIYGFMNSPRDPTDFSDTKIPADRGGVNSFTIENILKKLEGSLYDEVIITGFYDGILDPVDTGAYGSIQGFMDAKGFTTQTDVWQYLTQNWTMPVVVIINDSFLEGDPYSPTGRAQYASWLNQNDYLFLAYFQTEYNKTYSYIDMLLIDRRFGLTAFAWWGGYVPIQYSLNCRGADLNNDGGTMYTNLVPLIGVLSYGGISQSELTNQYNNLYIKYSKGSTDYIKFTNDLNAGIDLRVFAKITGITDHYILKSDGSEYKEEDLWDPESNPIYNINEQAGAYLSYIPRTNKVREKRLLKSKLYIRYIEPKQIESTNLIEGYLYVPMGLSTVIRRREPIMIYYDSDNYEHLESFTTGLVRFCDEPSAIECVGSFVLDGYSTDFEQMPYLNGNAGFIGVFFSKDACTATENNAFNGSNIYFLEFDYSGDSYISAPISTKDPDKKWTGYKGHYISANEALQDAAHACLFHTGKSNTAYPYDIDSNSAHLYLGDGSGGGDNPCFRWPPYKKCDRWAYVRDHGFSAYPDGTWDFMLMQDAHIIKFNPWNDEFQGNYDLASSGYNIEPNTNGIIHPIFFRPLIRITKIMGIEKVGAGDNIAIYIRTTDFNFLINNPTQKGLDRSSHATFGIVSFYMEDGGSIKRDDLLLFDEEVTVDKTNGYLFLNSPRLGSLDLTDVSYDGTSEYGFAWIYYKTQKDSVLYEEGPTDYKSYSDYDGPQTGTGKIEQDLGGLYSLADICYTVYPIGKYVAGDPMNTISSASLGIYPKNIPHGLWPWEVYYDDKIDEFAFEFNTGLLVGMAFWKDGKGTGIPTVVWSGCSEEDIKIMIENFIGQEIIYTDVEKIGDLWVYYNTLTEMLNIYEEDLWNPVAWPFRKTGYSKDDFIYNYSTNIFNYYESDIADEGELG